MIILTKSGLNSESIYNMSLVEVGSWIRSISMVNTGKRPVDPDRRRAMAAKNSAAVKELMKRKKSNSLRPPRNYLKIYAITQ